MGGRLITSPLRLAPRPSWYEFFQAIATSPKKARDGHSRGLVLGRTAIEDVEIYSTAFLFLRALLNGR
jgi:hypothetical protein